MSAAVGRWHAVRLREWLLELVLLHLGTLELDDELGLQVLVPRHNQLSHLAKRWDPLLPHEEEVSQIDLALRSSLIDGE